MESDVATLDAQRAADMMAIVESLSRLSQAQDDRDLPAYKAMFAETVLIDQPMIAGWEPKRMKASDWAETSISSLAGFDLTQHRLFNHVIDFDGDTASCAVDMHATHLLDEDGVTKEWLVGGRYKLKFARTEGRWLITERAFHIRFQGGDLSLVKKALKRAAAQ